MRRPNDAKPQGNWPIRPTAGSPTTSAPSALAVGDTERKQVYDKYYARGAFQFMTSTFADLLTDARANETAAQYLRDRIAERVHNPQTAELLTRGTIPTARSAQ